MAKVVSNATPLIYLAKVGKLSLLKELFGKITIPPEVHREVVTRGENGGHPEVVSVKKAMEEGWLVVQEAKVGAGLRKLAAELDRGELEVIALASANDAELTLIDDAVGRRVAEAFGLKVKGTLHVLMKARWRGLLSEDEAEATLHRLVSSGFRISAELYGAVLREMRTAGKKR